MKNALQYTYSVVVFVGVLITAYMMISQDLEGVGASRVIPNPALRYEARASDPALNSLLEMENALSAITSEREPSQRRKPSAEPRRNPVR